MQFCWLEQPTSPKFSFLNSCIEALVAFLGGSLVSVFEVVFWALLDGGTGSQRLGGNLGSVGGGTLAAGVRVGGGGGHAWWAAAEHRHQPEQTGGDTPSVLNQAHCRLKKDKKVLICNGLALQTLPRCFRCPSKPPCLPKLIKWTIKSLLNLHMHNWPTPPPFTSAHFWTLLVEEQMMIASPVDIEQASMWVAGKAGY